MGEGRRLVLYVSWGGPTAWGDGGVPAFTKAPKGAARGTFSLVYNKKGEYQLESEDRKKGKTKKLKMEREEAEAAASPPAKAARTASAPGSDSSGLDVLAVAATGAGPGPSAAAAPPSARLRSRPQLARMECARPAGVTVDPGPDPAIGGGPSVPPPQLYADDYEVVSESSDSDGVEDASDGDDDVDVARLESSDGD